MNYETLQVHRGKATERWCFSVTPLDGQEKVLFPSPYVYEKLSRTMIQDEDIVAGWHARVQGLAAANGGKWTARVPEPLHWDTHIEREVRKEQLHHMNEMDEVEHHFHDSAED